MITAAHAPGRTWWRRRRTRRLATQAAFTAAVVLILLYLASRATRLELGLGFFSDRAGFAISHQWGTAYTGNQSRLDAYLVGVFNTIRLVITGLVLATLVGVIVGVSRLSKNWLVSRLATVYVEVFRNTPLLIQIIIWYTAVLLQLPPQDRGLSFLDVVFLSNRALAIPWAFPQGRFGPWVVLLAAAGVVAWFVRRRSLAREEATGRPAHATSLGLATFVVAAAIAYVVVGRPLELDTPALVTSSGGQIATISGGMQVTPEFAALLIALVIYTGAFIAEIVRGSIQALPRGQNEAAMALGLSSYQRMTLIILPQALRIIIPPLTNQYLNLTKNSSLAVAIAFPDLVFVGRTIQNNAGHAVPVFLAIMATYLAMSALIATLMGALNRRVQRASR